MVEDSRELVEWCFCGVRVRVRVRVRGSVGCFEASVRV